MSEATTADNAGFVSVGWHDGMPRTFPVSEDGWLFVFGRRVGPGSHHLSPGKAGGGVLVADDDVSAETFARLRANGYKVARRG
jgi:hypothetical protein